MPENTAPLGRRVSKKLVTSSCVAKILGVSRQRIQQLISNKALPPKYVFNRQSKRKLYVFEMRTISKFSDLKTRASIKWIDPEDSELVTVPELAKEVGCPSPWIYESTRKGIIRAELVLGDKEGRYICLYDTKHVQEVWDKRNERGSARGFRKKTLKLIEKIKELNESGVNDSQIALSLRESQPLITRLRNQIGLKPVRGRGRPKMLDE